jgi:hypothetical protein
LQYWHCTDREAIDRPNLKDASILKASEIMSLLVSLPFSTSGSHIADTHHTLHGSEQNITSTWSIISLCFSGVQMFSVLSLLYVLRRRAGAVKQRQVRKHTNAAPDARHARRKVASVAALTALPFFSRTRGGANAGEGEGVDFDYERVHRDSVGPSNSLPLGASVSTLSKETLTSKTKVNLPPIPLIARSVDDSILYAPSSDGKGADESEDARMHTPADVSGDLLVLPMYYKFLLIHAFHCAMWAGLCLLLAFYVGCASALVTFIPVLCPLRRKSHDQYAPLHLHTTG